MTTRWHALSPWPGPRRAPSGAASTSIRQSSEPRIWPTRPGKLPASNMPRSRRLTTRLTRPPRRRFTKTSITARTAKRSRSRPTSSGISQRTTPPICRNPRPWQAADCLAAPRVRTRTSPARSSGQTWPSSPVLAVARDWHPRSHARRGEHSAHAQLLLQGGGRGGVLEQQLLARIDDVVGGLRHQRHLVKARQDELQLAGVGVDVADGEDARFAGLELLGIHGDEVLIQVEPPIGDRPELHGEPEEGQ